MKRIESKQQRVPFFYLPNPFTIDKSKDWGEGNIQKFPNGGFVKIVNKKVSHGVQPNRDHSAPVGWVKNSILEFLYDKAPIWVIRKLEVGTTENISTLDGHMDYEVKEPSYLVCQDNDGNPEIKDSWVISEKNLKENYYYEESDNER